MVFQLIQHLLWKHGNAMGVRASHYASLPCADPEDSMATFGSKKANILSVMDIVDMTCSNKIWPPEIYHQHPKMSFSGYLMLFSDLVSGNHPA